MPAKHADDRGWREKFREWRSTRPFAGGLLMLSSGIIMVAPAYFTVQISDLLVMISTISGVSTLLIGALLIMFGIGTWMQPYAATYLGVLGIIVAIIAVPTSNLGGFFIGSLFGIVGAFLAVPVAAVAAVWLRYWAEMVSLRSGEITADEIQIATQQTQTMDSKQSFLAVRDHMMKMAKRERPNTKVPVKEGLGSTRVPTGDEAIETHTDTEVPGRARALEEQE